VLNGDKWIFISPIGKIVEIKSEKKISKVAAMK
jgi:hypothetical protein